MVGMEGDGTVAMIWKMMVLNRKLMSSCTSLSRRARSWKPGH